ncbi:hypothetical protein AYI70_g10280, partial [Smittium culicis]
MRVLPREISWKS